MKRKRLGDVLQGRGMLTAENLQQLFEEQGGTRLGELILERGLVDRSVLIEALEEVSHVPYLDCSSVKCERALLKMIPKSTAVRLALLPVRTDDTRIVVAMAEPQNIAAIDELRFATGSDISPRFAFRSEILAAVARNYAAGDISTEADSASPLPEPEVLDGGETMEFISTSSRQANREAIEAIQAELHQNRTPAVRLVSEIILKAMDKLASDIHIEPQATATAIRIRVDGVLRELESAPRSVQNSLISRIKILADMDIGDRRAPQDGRFTVAVGGRRVDLRVSTLPTQYGEKVVMRLLETSAPMLKLSDLGFPENISEKIKRMLTQPQGLLLVTGPTGSGKTSTLYSALNVMRKPEINIVTVEDPVEYNLPGINQVHVNKKAGLTFVSCLRSILRQDPNVIMIGEIRDLETAEIAMKAAQTGHMVLSTLHTNDSISAIVRLIDLGIPEYLIASSTSGILAQRLVRRLCVCHTFKPVTPEQAKHLGEIGCRPIPDRIAGPAGCLVCDQTGYKGRVGVYELLVVDESIREILRGTFKPDLIRSAARANGMRPMLDDALDKLRLGMTTLDEILRVVPIELSVPTECHRCGHELMAAFRFCSFCGAKVESGKSAGPVNSSSDIPDKVLSS
jgi:type IV pilus assembly protein PilB